MKRFIYYTLIGFGLVSLGVVMSASVPQAKQKNKAIDMIYTNVDGVGTNLNFKVEAGSAHNHPTFAVWIESLDGNYMQLLYVSKSLASGVYLHGQKEDGLWSREPGAARRPATLPYFLHKRGIKAPDGTYLPSPDNPIIDAYTAATPKYDFTLGTRADENLSGKMNVLLEVNQPWDWNEYWTNTLYPNDVDYATSSQPSLVYSVTVDFDKPMDYYMLNLIGHGHYSGKDGKLYTDLSTITTAKNIFKKIELRISK